MSSALVRIGVLLGATLAALHLLSRAIGDADPSDVTTLVARAAGGLVVSAVVVLVVLVLTRVERRRLRDVGLGPAADGWRLFLLGALAWRVPAALAFGVLALLGAPLTVTAPADRFWTALAWLLLAVLLSEAVPEELAFRGHLTAVLAERLRGWAVIAVQTALFTAAVLVLRGGLGLLDLSLFVAMGAVLGYLRTTTGSAWTTIGFHVAFQTGSQLVLTHDVVELDGSTALTMLALGAVPFTVAVLVLPALGRVPQRAARRRPTD